VIEAEWTGTGRLSAFRSDARQVSRGIAITAATAGSTVFNGENNIVQSLFSDDSDPNILRAKTVHAR
jgi:hypothetical protein